LPYPNHAGVLTTAGGIVVIAMLDGTIIAYDDATLDELWRSRWHRLRRAANDLCGQWQAVHRHRLGINPVGRAKLAPLAGNADRSQRHHAVRVRAVIARGLDDSPFATALG